MYKTHLSSSHTPLHPHTIYTNLVLFKTTGFLEKVSLWQQHTGSFAPGWHDLGFGAASEMAFVVLLLMILLLMSLA